jgi:hypothetical protein
MDENNETLNTKIEKFDPSTLFADPAYFKTKARIEQISKSEVMTPEEKLNTYRDIIKEAKAENEKLKKELAELKAQMAPAPSTTEGGAAGEEVGASESGAEPEAAPAAAPAPKKKGKKKK